MTHNNAPTYKAVLKSYNSCSPDVMNYFGCLPNLIKDDYPYEIALAYIFLKTEQAQNRTLYGGVIKLHKANARIANRAINQQHLTREGFLKLYKNIFGTPLSENTHKKLNRAEYIRDKVIHGKKVSANEIRQAIVDVLKYAEDVNAELQELAGFSPFGDLRGFSGRSIKLEENTTRWLLKGLGFEIK